MSEEGIAEQPADDLTSELEAAFEESEAEPVDSEIIPEEESEEIIPEATEQTIEPQVEPEVTSAPDNWSDDDKTTFSALSELGDQGKAAQEFLLDRHKSMEGDYTRKNQERADAMREFEPIQQAFEPYTAVLQAQGLTPAAKIQQWAQIEQNLASNPAETIQWLAQQNNVDLNNMEYQPEVSPELTGLKRELQDLRNSITQREQADQQTRMNTIGTQISEFSEMTTEAGDLAHPYFADVMDEIVALAGAERQAGREPDLAAMYDKAVWMNTSTRDKLITSQKAAEEKQKLDDARQKAAKAKHASSSVSGTPDGASPTDDLDLREQLAQAFS
ncbi:MAG: hypothetical protein JKY88_09095 [Pseudomonadales bacterium]|nr:hypothetical protein [Pseudomonadales bacterium]